ncbi:thioredoxin reductase [Cardiosporidium cionae]|uniref:Thioredoxin reductase n=1 Tax=Cardiosporidium cionae TaxID=476202 RepID=A0ABQ7JFC7_9APIC|nr:thioredoxin reductase [Cardiosporidium cionae]|eukprot:KAF8822671.1 thioredoxin reductase [Cardiosporidium cionae]
MSSLSLLRYSTPPWSSISNCRAGFRTFRNISSTFRLQFHHSKSAKTLLAAGGTFQQNSNSSVVKLNQSIDSFSTVAMDSQYDLAVIGGGSGGLAAAKEAAHCGAKVVLFDFVTPSSQGTKWGLGGTCVNVGCVPKKLMHYAASMGPVFHHDGAAFGWKNSISKDTNERLANAEGANSKYSRIEGSGENAFDWISLVKTVQNHVRSLNFSYRGGLRSAQVQYINATARFKGPTELVYTLNNVEKSLTAKHIILATGGRPYIPEDVPGAKELSITSDDLFSLKTPPRKTLVVGGAYIALECAGFLTEFGYDVTVAVRSILLRGFDRQCSEKVGQLMAETGTKFLYSVTPKSLTQQSNGRILVEFNGASSDEFDTVLYATGRSADTIKLNLSAAGVSTTSSGKIHTINEQTEVPHIYALGDILDGKPELTPVAIKAGELLVRRLFGNETALMNYKEIPTTIFTPFEYGCCGLSEEEAIALYSAENIETFLSEFVSLEIAAAHREKIESQREHEFDTALSPNCLSKLICLKNENMRVVGFHYVGRNAGEVTQGMALALRLKATKEDFDHCVGIHPTDAESFMGLAVTKSSGESWVAAGGCGGGKCG